MVATNSFLPALPYARAAALEFRKACTLIADDRTPDADPVIRSIDSQILTQHYDNVVNQWTPRHEASGAPLPSSTANRARDRMPSKTIERGIFERDGWHCRWCGTPVISARANKRMSLVFPVAYKKGPRNVDIHGLIMSTQASLDHVVPHSLGGTNDPDNLVTACWPCQFARGNDDFRRLGLNDPRSRSPLNTDWDGCDWFKP